MSGAGGETAGRGLCLGGSGSDCESGADAVAQSRGKTWQIFFTFDNKNSQNLEPRGN